MDSALRLIRFTVDGQSYGLPFHSVERVIRAVELTPLPGAPHAIRGVFILHGMLLPVADPRRRLGLSDCALALDDRIIVVRTPTRRLGLLVDADMDLADCAEGDVMPPDPVLSGLQFEGIARLEDGLILIHDLAKFLSLDEERSLDEALGAAPAAPPPAMQDAPA